MASCAGPSPLSSGMICCFSRANIMKGAFFATFLKEGVGDGASGGGGENDVDIFDFKYSIQFNFYVE